MNSDYNQNYCKHYETQIIKILISIGPNNVGLIKYGAIYKSEFPLLLRLKFIKGRHKQ